MIILMHVNLEPEPSEIQFYTTLWSITYVGLSFSMFKSRNSTGEIKT